MAEGTTWTLNAGQFTTEAYRRLGILPAGGVPDNDQMAQGIVAINSVLTSWELDGPTRTRQTQISVAVAPNQGYPGNPVIITPVVMDVPATRWVITPAPNLYERPLGQIDYTDYMNYPNKQQATGAPASYTWDKQVAATWLYLFPLPNVSGTLNCTVIRTANDVALSTDAVDIPQEWTGDFIYTVADWLMDNEGVAAADPETAKRITLRAAYFRKVIEDFDRPQTVRFRPYGRAANRRIWR